MSYDPTDARCGGGCDLIISLHAPGESYTVRDGMEMCLACAKLWDEESPGRESERDATELPGCDVCDDPDCMGCCDVCNDPECYRNKGSKATPALRVSVCPACSLPIDGPFRFVDGAVTHDHCELRYRVDYLSERVAQLEKERDEARGWARRTNSRIMGVLGRESL